MPLSSCSVIAAARGSVVTAPAATPVLALATSFPSFHTVASPIVIEQSAAAALGETPAHVGSGSAAATRSPTGTDTFMLNLHGVFPCSCQPVLRLPCGVQTVAAASVTSCDSPTTAGATRHNSDPTTGSTPATALKKKYDGVANI